MHTTFTAIFTPQPAGGATATAALLSAGVFPSCASAADSVLGCVSFCSSVPTDDVVATSFSSASSGSTTFVTMPVTSSDGASSTAGTTFWFAFFFPLNLAQILLIAHV